MKKLIYLSCVLILSITVAFGQSKDVRQLNFFNAIHSSGSWNVFIKKGSSEKVVIEADAGPIDKIETDIEDNTLKIRLEDWKWSVGNNFKNVRIYVTFTELGEVVSSGSGNMRLESAIESEDIMIKSSGSGNFYIEEIIRASDDLKIANSGSSDIRILASVIAGDDSEIHNSGSGDIEVNSFFANELEINNSGSGGVEIGGGEISEQSIRLSGSGNIKMEDLKSKECEIRKSGSGNVYVSVSEILRGSSSGSGNVYVKNGRPRLDFHFSGSGKIKYL